MTVVNIKRTEGGNLAVRLREIAMRIERGELVYVALYAMDSHGKVDEVVADLTAKEVARIA